MRSPIVLLVLLLAAVTEAGVPSPGVVTKDGGAAPVGKGRASPGHPPKRVKVSGVAASLHETFPCMGGAAVTDEMILREQTPLSNQRLTVFAGADLSGKIVARPETDASGRFSTRLPPGSYCVAVGDHRPRAIADGGPALALSPAEPHEPGSPCQERRAPPPPACAARIFVSESGTSQVQLLLTSRNQCPQAWAQPCYRGDMPP